MKKKIQTWSYKTCRDRRGLHPNSKAFKACMRRHAKQITPSMQASARREQARDEELCREEGYDPDNDRNAWNACIDYRTDRRSRQYEATQRARARRRR